MHQERPSTATLIGLLFGSVVGIIAAQGPLVSAVRITIAVETQVGQASNLPDAWTLPATLEGLGAVALVYLITVRPKGRMRAWCVALVVTTLLAGMAAQGTHALWYDPKAGKLALPAAARLLISFIPPLSGGAALHLVVSMLEGLIVTVRLLVERPEAPGTQAMPDVPGAPLPAAPESLAAAPPGLLPAPALPAGSDAGADVETDATGDAGPDTPDGSEATRPVAPEATSAVASASPVVSAGTSGQVSGPTSVSGDAGDDAGPDARGDTNPDARTDTRGPSDVASGVGSEDEDLSPDASGDAPDSDRRQPASGRAAVASGGDTPGQRKARAALERASRKNEPLPSGARLAEIAGEVDGRTYTERSGQRWKGLWEAEIAASRRPRVVGGTGS